MSSGEKGIDGRLVEQNIFGQILLHRHISTPTWTYSWPDRPEVKGLQYVRMYILTWMSTPESAATYKFWYLVKVD